MKKELGIWGWWQGENLGDQWIKHTMEGLFPNAEFIETSDTNLRRFSFVICGGGGLFIHDVTKVWKTVPRSVSFGALGLGAEFPHANDAAKKLAAKAKFFYVRDEYSLSCMHLDNIERSFDITFAAPLPLRKKELLLNNHCFFVWRTPEEWMSEDEKFQTYQQADYDYYEWERVVNRNFDCVDRDDFITYDSNIYERIKESDFVISGRYHGIVAAIQRGIPCIAIDLCPKIRSLMREVGLEKYCLKLNQADRLEELIKDAKQNVSEIRSLELLFKEKASKIIKKHVNLAKLEIYKVIHPLKLIHYGFYYFGKNDVVSVMADALHCSSGAILKEVKVWKFFHSLRIKAISPTPNGTISILNPVFMMIDCILHRPDAVILNSGGLTLDKLGYRILRKLGIILVGIELSDPDVYPYNGSVYSSFFQLFYTNAEYSLNHQYAPNRAKLLGFAASESHHYFIPEVERKYDIVIVGGCRPDRVEIVSELKKYFHVGLYGSGWEDSLGVVSGKDLVRAINSGKVYLSFSRTMAGYYNVKVGLFEAVACKSFVITEYMEELQMYFEIGKEIECYQAKEELIDKIRYYLLHEKERLAIAENGYQRYLNEHTYCKRWNQVLADIYEQKGMSIDEYLYSKG